MDYTKNFEELMLTDELVNDFEFTENLYKTEFIQYQNQKINTLYWADMA